MLYSRGRSCGRYSTMLRSLIRPQHFNASPSSALGSSHTHWGWAPSSASSWACCSRSLLRFDDGRARARSPRGRDHDCALACSHAWPLDWASQCCCPARCPSRRSSSCPTTRHSTRRLRGARGICSILFAHGSAVALAKASNGTTLTNNSGQVHVHTFAALLAHAFVVNHILGPLDVAALFWLGA